MAATCARMLEALAPGFEQTEIGSPDDVEVGVAWVELGNPLVRARVQAAAELFPHRRSVEFPLVDGSAPVFMREAAQSHRGLFPEPPTPTATTCSRSSSAACR